MIVPLDVLQIEFSTQVLMLSDPGPTVISLDQPCSPHLLFPVCFLCVSKPIKTSPWVGTNHSSRSPPLTKRIEALGTRMSEETNGAHAQNRDRVPLSDETLTFVDWKLSLPLSDGSEIASISSKLNCSSVVSSMNNLSNSSKSISYSELAAILIGNSEFDPSPLHHTFLLGRARFIASALVCFVRSWIIERLDRKLADVIGSNIVKKCDVTLSRVIKPLTSNLLRVLFLLAYFTISVFDYTYWPCFEVKDEEDLLLEKTVRGYKTGWGKRGSKWLWNLWERRMTPAPDNFMH